MAGVRLDRAENDFDIDDVQYCYECTTESIHNYYYVESENYFLYSNKITSIVSLADTPWKKAGPPIETAAAALAEAVGGLRLRHPDLCAASVPSRPQAVLLAGMPMLAALAVLLVPGAAAMLAAIALAGLFLGNTLFRAMLVWLGAHAPLPTAPASASAAALLPRYSVLVPLYREAAVVPWLLAALRKLDYPPHLLEVFLVVEADDEETAAAVVAEAPDAHFTLLRVPVAAPRTKPKALNYALQFATGDLIAVYDAEDRPEANQLLDAVAAFRRAPLEVVCLQARLNFFNADENWLTRMFALDYGLWFDLLLPGLDRLRVPMPLGGTSNHFRIEALRAIGGWDPYNVTEDADLGVRLARLGWRASILDSTTFEEATVGFGNWLRQRTRWMKGYMQTWLVHMRDPARLWRQAGAGGFLGFQLFVAGTVATALLNPVLAALFVADMIAAPTWIAPVVPQICGPALVAGYGLFAWLAMLGSYRRGWLQLSPYGLFAPVYWLLISLAAYRALFQLFTDPWRWEKTEHGRSRLGAVAGC